MSHAQADETILSEQSREQLRADVSRAAEPVALNWPITTFISRNPLAGYEHLPFHEAVTRGRRLLGGEGYLSVAEYRDSWRRGRIEQEDLEWALKQLGPNLGAGSSLSVGSRQIVAQEVLFLRLIHGIEPIDAATLSWKIQGEQALRAFQPVVPEFDRGFVPSGSDGMEWPSRFLASLWDEIAKKLPLPQSDRNKNLLRLSPLQTAVELVDRLTGSAHFQLLNEELIKWLSAFTDEGLGDWAMPGRELGFYSAWRALARHDMSGWFLGIGDLSKKLQSLPEQPEDALNLLLHRLEIPQDLRIDYCSRHLAHLHGWAGYIRWNGQQPDHAHPINPVQYLAVRVFYETELTAAACSASSGLKPTFPQLCAVRPVEPGDVEQLHEHSSDALSDSDAADAWRLFLLAQHLGLTPSDITMLQGHDARTLITWLDSIPAETIRPIWHEAYERLYRRRLISRLRLPAAGATPAPTENRPLAQAVFCIDVRSEPFRRHLESQGAYETIGFAGFFGVPLCYRALDREDDLSLCPILIKPKFAMQEAPRPDHAQVSEAHLRGTYWHEISDHIFHRLKANPLSSYMLIDLAGALFAFALIGKTLLLSLYHRLANGVLRWLIPPVPTNIPVGTQPQPSPPPNNHHRDPGPPHGLSDQEQAAVVENSLRVMGLTKRFGRIVLICGHGSTTENNPYASAYDCGACGGNHGSPNARVLARMANRPETRTALKANGVLIPDDCLFLAAEHNTTTDRVTFYDLEDLPTSHRDDQERLARALDKAGAEAAAERCGRIPGASRFAKTDLAPDHVEARGLDWAQTRPEWGLSGNAAFIIGRRTLTKSLSLEGRVFLHNYDASTDEAGKVLETIMTAPLVVAEWINLQYYFSTVDSWTYGSGSKVLHNVVGGIGVMLGRHSDLQTGLPIQSVKDGARPFHEPMRLLAIIEATTERLSQIIGRHLVLQQFFNHQWVHLTTIDPVTGTVSEYRPGGHWVTVAAQQSCGDHP